MRSFSNIIKIALILISFSAFSQVTADIKIEEYKVPAWVSDPQTEHEKFMAYMLTSSTGAKNWVFCYRCAFGRTDVDKKITKKNCLKVYKIWDEKDRDVIKSSCH